MTSRNDTMATATVTKAQLSAELEQANAAIEELRQQLAAQHQEQQAQSEQAPDLCQKLWLTKACDQRQTPNGNIEVRFGGRISRLDKRSGQRVYGAWKNFKAYGTQAAAVLELYATDNRLVRIEAFETSWTGKDQRVNTDWVVTTIEAIERQAPAAAPAQAPAAVSAPTLFEPDQDIPF